jgi:hypothetical protein
VELGSAVRIGLGLVLALTVVGCGVLPWPSTPTPGPTEIPFGGERASITPMDLAAAREGMPGGLVEPSWLPDGFELMFVAFYGGLEDSTDLHYNDGEHQLHIWQAFRGPGELGPKEPFDYGDRIPIGDTVEWHSTSLEDQLRTDGLVEYRGRMPDGRTVTVDSTLDAEVMERILQSLYVRAPGEG